MSENWENEDWENEDWEALILKTAEEIRKLEERKLVEEADNELSYDLFTADDKKIEKTANILTNQFLEKDKEKLPSKMRNTKSNQQLNEEKQKELSMKIKKQKKEKQREKEIFGEAKEDKYNKYSQYEDYFYD